MRLSDAEWKVMNMLWETSPRSAREVLEGLEEATGWKYSTVKTLLTRLVGKKAVSVRRRGNTGYYTPKVTRDSARRNALRSLVDRAFEGGVAPLVRFLMTDRKLTERERAELEGMLREIQDEDATKGRDG